MEISAGPCSPSRRVQEGDWRLSMHCCVGEGLAAFATMSAAWQLGLHMSNELDILKTRRQLNQISAAAMRDTAEQGHKTIESHHTSFPLILAMDSHTHVSHVE